MIRYELHFDTKALEPLMQKAFESLVLERQRGVTGYYDLPFSSMRLLERIPNYPHIKKIAIIGIGGSSLGTKAIYELLRHRIHHKEIIFLENPDPIDLEDKFSRIKKNETLFIVISKSGTTIETISIFKAAIKHFELEFQKDNLIFITDPGSPLERLGSDKGVPVYNIPPNVGGRFSVLSAVGIVPLTIAGFDTENLLLGAGKLVIDFFAHRADHILKKAAFYYSHYPDIKMNVLFSYSSMLLDFNRWYEQLWGESLGKRKGDERIGLTPIAHIGSIDQHSFLQLLIDGPLDKSVTFLKVKEFRNHIKIPQISLPHLESTDFVNGHTFNELINKECEATMESVMMQGVPVDLIEIGSIKAKNIGELIIYYQLLTSAVGALFGIDTYNQPGVELGKKILKEKF
ncbi:MAG: glucose-6-phosphate isomerase [Epsilonproteobacteria bacterium]|nr:glucose-6-phosphate isomerase [Campylobacterota bacterium]NPA64073.1 glucose-6-phosphate isomerase [Campylobacterota bacterium]